MKKLIPLFALFLFLGCKKDAVTFYVLQLSVTSSSSSKVIMEIDDQRNNRIFTTSGLINNYPTDIAKVRSGDVLKVHYSSNVAYNPSTFEGMGTLTFKWQETIIHTVTGDFGHTTGKTIYITIPEKP